MTSASPFANRRYFAAQNSADGFLSRFGDVFTGLDRLYIIKGGPGTGKSRLLFDLANEAALRGFNVEYYYCSSDPLSLDGIIIDEMRMGFIDGTPPHSVDLKYPGAYDELLDLGAFWNTKRLYEKREQIVTLSDTKARLYGELYSYLSAAGTVRRVTCGIIRQAIDDEKLKAKAQRFFKKTKLTGDCGYSEKIRLTDGITMDGYVRFDTFRLLAAQSYRLTGRFDIAHFYLDALRDEARRHGIPVHVSYSPLLSGMLNGLYFPTLDVAFTSGGEPCAGERVINSERFINPDISGTSKHKLRFGRRCYTSLMEGAYEVFGKIKAVHFSLEEIYCGAMDFVRKEEYTKKLLIKIYT